MLARFFTDRRASVVPLFGLAVIPMIGLVGAAVDYSRASTLRSSLQAVVDTAALAMSKDAATISPGQLQANAEAYFNAVFNRPEAKNPSISAVYTSSNGSKVVVTGTASINTTMMGILGFPELSVSATSTSTWGNSRLRVALVLDNTGSMLDYNKIGALKTATHNLLDQLKAAALQDGDVYVSIVPFNRDVNAKLDSTTYQQPWFDWTDWDSKNGKNVVTGQTCSLHNGRTTCKDVTTWTPATHDTWNGCLADRDQNYDTMNTSPAAGAQFVPDQYSSCPASIMPLSYDWTALNAKVDDMVATGNTNQTIGLAWGWQSLSDSQPLNAPPTDPNYTYQKIIILLTDGLNTQNRWSTSQSSIDLRTAKACQNIKDAGIQLYTVQVNTGGSDPTSQMLKNCATDTGKFFLLKTADQIVATFQQIGTTLSKLRIAS